MDKVCFECELTRQQCWNCLNALELKLALLRKLGLSIFTQGLPKVLQQLSFVSHVSCCFSAMQSKLKLYRKVQSISTCFAQRKYCFILFYHTLLYFVLLKGQS